MALTTNYQLAEACAKYNIPLVGVFSKNDMPRKIDVGGYIVNLSDSHDEDGKPLPGTHWVSFFIERTKRGHMRAVYFDPFGVVPPVSVQRFLASMRPYPYCSFNVQNINSGVCGYYAVEFLWFMSKNRLRYPDVDKRFEMFLDRYSYNPEQNLRLLEGFLQEIKT